MNTFMIKRVGIMALGGVAGGLIGYFLASLVIDRLLEQEYFEEEVEENTEIKVGTPEIADFKKEPKKRDYTKYSTEKKSLEELVKPYTEGSDNSKQNNIRVISLEEYESDRTANIELIYYYAGDTTFSNANEDIIPNPQDFFGPNIQLHFGEKSGDPDIVYVRNENNGVNYEITQFEGKYHVIVLGEPDEEPKPKAKRRKTVTKKDASFKGEESIDDEGED